MRRIQFAMIFLTGAALLSAGCGSDAETPGTGGKGSGGKGGSGAAGAKGSGGAVGTGGSGGSSTGSGGAVGTGGSSTGGSSTGGSSTGGSNAGGSSSGGSAAGGSAGAAGGSAGKGGAAGGSAGHGGGSAGHGGAAGAAGGAAGHAGAAGGSAGEGGHAGAAGSAGGAAGSAGGAAGGAGGGGGGSAPDPVALRGSYLFNSVLGCAGCHTPTNGTSPSGRDCFVSTVPGGGATCLSAPNLTNDDTGLKMRSAQQIREAFLDGKKPSDSSKYLFATMPYYQFKNLSTNDADAIVTYLRSIPGVNHTVAASMAPYDVPPTTPEYQAVVPTDLPTGSQATGPANGKYLATLACATCHTVEVSGATPKRIDPTKAFQGGKVVNTTVGGNPKMLQSANLTPDATGLMTWNTSQIANTIQTAKGKDGTTALCGMRGLANMTTSDATDIATYLLSIPAVSNMRIMTCAP